MLRRLMADVGLRVNEACKLDLADVKWDLGLFGKLHIRHGKGRPRLRATQADGSPDQQRRRDAAVVRGGRVGKEAARTHLPDWPDIVTPHVLRHFCASELYLAGMDLIAIQATLGHA